MPGYTRLSCGLAVLALLLAQGCATTPSGRGATTGGVLGAGLGAIIGHQSGHQGEGAVIGAVLGAMTGAIAGDQVEKERTRHSVPVAVQRSSQPEARGHYEVHVLRSPSGERYEERVWVPDHK